MKASRMGLAILLAGFVWAAGLMASARDDYRVIKNAVAGTAVPRAEKKNAQYFKIQVTRKNGKQEVVKITLPISLVEIMINACPEKKFAVEHGCHIDIRRIWNDLKAAGPLCMIEAEDHGEMVRIWLE